MHKEEVDICVVALSSPVLVGIYKENKLYKTIETSEKSSEILPALFQDILKNYKVKRIFYANGPGSFMAIKIAYVFLKSLSILKKIPLFAIDAFYFNNMMPIKAIGKLYFVKIAGEIKMEKFPEIPISVFTLPEILEVDDFSTNTTPLYSIGAVG
ncbi:MAG: hypothetical protein RBR59_06690 [Sulfurimonadaceae bacterium]|jgi:tRNA A37 threonylcarbamoyladenosine modification protein TsaB|nr:hypothetical protein [Sulfurimonadaceae bacterium]